MLGKYTKLYNIANYSLIDMLKMLIVVYTILAACTAASAQVTNSDVCN